MNALVENLWVGWTVFFVFNFGINFAKMVCFSILTTPANEIEGKLGSLATGFGMSVLTFLLLIRLTQAFFNGYILFLLFQSENVSQWGFAKWVFAVFLVLAIIQSFNKPKSDK